MIGNHHQNFDIKTYSSFGLNVLSGKVSGIMLKSINIFKKTRFNLTFLDFKSVDECFIIFILENKNYLIKSINSSIFTYYKFRILNNVMIFYISIVLIFSILYRGIEIGIENSWRYFEIKSKTIAIRTNKIVRNNFVSSLSFIRNYCK